MANTGREDKNPWTKWYWADWESDIGLQLCSLASQGLWMQMLSIMARSKNKGYLLDGENQMETKMLAKKARSTVEEIGPLLQDLRDHNVFSETPDGMIYNRRMVRDAKLSKVRQESGKKGGRPKSKRKANGNQDPKQHVKGPSASAYASAYASASNKNKNLIEEIIIYLNEKADKKFSSKSEETIKFINGRLAEGRTLEDFKYVIDIKVVKWKGKTWVDNRTGKEVQLDDYLRPSTLFRPGNFEDYMNEKIPEKKETWAEKKTRELKERGEIKDGD